MKKNQTVNSSKKLVLNKQTIRALKPVDLQRLAGGNREVDTIDTGDPGSGEYCC